MLQTPFTNNFYWTSNSIARNELSFKYEPLQPLLLLEIINTIKAEYFFDIGANIGLYTVLMSLSEYITKIFCYEPSKETYQELDANIKLNNLFNKAIPYYYAVSSKDGVSNFYIESPLSGINSIVDTSFHNKNLFHDIIEIKTIALDNYYNYTSKNIAFKIDVEGHEKEVILGAQKLISSNNCIIQIEIMPDNFEYCKNLLFSLGYMKIFSIKNDHYFTNIPYNNKLIKTFENVSEHFIDLLHKKWPHHTKNDLINTNTITNNNKISINIDIDRCIFKNPEFAFYVYQDTQILKKIMYQNSNTLDIFLYELNKKKKLSVTIFVRDMENYSIISKKHIEIIY